MELTNLDTNEFTKIKGYKYKLLPNGVKQHFLNGKRLLSPSRILKHLTNLSEVPPYILEQAVARGSAIADAIETYTYTGETHIQDQYKAIFQQFLNFLKQTKLEAIQAEIFILEKRKGYCGYVDLICFDTKTQKTIGVEVKTRDIDKYPQSYVSNKLQAAFYKQALNVDEFIVLSLDSKGKGYNVELINDTHIKDANQVLAYYKKYIGEKE